MKTNIHIARRGFTLVELLVVIVIIAALAGLTAPMVIRQRKKADQTQAVSNARQIGMALLEFESEFGSFPGAATQTQLDLTFSSAVIKGDTAGSNGYFRQLFQAGLTQSEDMFYAKIKGSIKPDGDISAQAKALAAKEVGFAYILDGLEGLNTGGNPARIVVGTPLFDKTNFDIGPFDKKAVVLRIDNSVSSMNIDVAAGETKGPAKIGAESILATTNPIWEGSSPDAILPE